MCVCAFQEAHVCFPSSAHLCACRVYCFNRFAYVFSMCTHVCLNWTCVSELVSCSCDRALAQPHLRLRAHLPNLSSGAVLKSEARQQHTCSSATRDGFFCLSVLDRRKPQAVGMFVLAHHSSAVCDLCWCNIDSLHWVLAPVMYGSFLLDRFVCFAYVSVCLSV